MKVILAGMPKTGTKTMAHALRVLGYSVHDLLEQYQYNRHEWKRILLSGGTVDDFKKMYENVDAVADLPAIGCWEELHHAFPDAKVRTYLYIIPFPFNTCYLYLLKNMSFIFGLEKCHGSLRN